MGFDITGLGSYVANNKKEIAIKSIASAPTAKALIDSGNVQYGVKGQSAILKLNSSVSLIDGSTCGARTGGSTIALLNKNLVVSPIRDEANVCTDSLWNTFYSFAVAQGQAPQEELLPAFANQIMEERASKIAAVNEQLIWRGDTSLTGTTNLKRINGIGVQVTASTSTATGTTILNKLQNFFLACNVDNRNQDDFRIVVGQDIYAEYKIALAALNIYQPVDDMSVYGTTAKFHVTSGLNSVRRIYGLRWSNLQLGMDGQGDADKAELRYSIETTQFYQDFAYALGVAVVWNDSSEAIYATV